MSYPRDTLAILVGIKLKDQYYLVIKSVNEDSNSGCVKANFKQIIQITLGKENNKYGLLTIIMESDFKGYNTAEDNKSMSLILLKNI